MLSILSSSAFGMQYLKLSSLVPHYNWNFDSVAVANNGQTSYINESVINYGSSGWDLNQGGSGTLRFNFNNTLGDGSGSAYFSQQPQNIEYLSQQYCVKSVNSGSVNNLNSSTKNLYFGSGDYKISIKAGPGHVYYQSQVFTLSIGGVDVLGNINWAFDGARNDSLYGWGTYENTLFNIASSATLEIKLQFKNTTTSGTGIYVAEFIIEKYT